MSTKQTWDAAWQNSRSPTSSELVEELNREQRSPRCQHILRFIEAHGFKVAGLSVIEVGCGSAIYGCVMARMGAIITALDQSEEALARAQERAKAVGVELETIQGEAVEFARARQGTFDVAMSFGTVEHFRPPLREQMCKVHWDLVRRGGIVVISVPNLLFLPHEVLKRVLIMRGKWFLGYEGSFTAWELERIGRGLGLVQLDLHGTDLKDDLLKYWRIVRNTRLWTRLLPWWRLAPGDRAGSGRVSAPPGRLGALANRYFGRDITLLGVKKD